MDLTGAIDGTNIFSLNTQQSSQLENLANSAIQSGIDRFVNKDYEGAIKEFKRAIGLSQTSSYAADAAQYMAEAYLQLDDTDGAVNAYKEAIRLNPYRDDSHIKLGNLYFAQKRYSDAVSEYEEAVRLNGSAENVYALGQGYLTLDRYSDAEIQFTKVDRLQPQDPAGKFGLGQTYSKQGRYDDAIRVFKDAIEMKPDFYDAYAEIGYASADSGQMDEAQQIVDSLERSDQPDLADTVSRYMYKVDPPKISFASYSSSFPYFLRPKTRVSALHSYLQTADASKTFTMVFQFDKEMDRESVENVANWAITRSIGAGPGQAYNLGFPPPSTEVYLTPIPESVYYDPKELTATVYFKVQQNANADGTIDPTHIEFKFSGKDKYGLSMNTRYDQFTGFSGVF
jgi:tetratricopeptide (TPR) repeat protein